MEPKLLHQFYEVPDDLDLEHMQNSNGSPQETRKTVVDHTHRAQKMERTARQLEVNHVVPFSLSFFHLTLQ